MLRRCVSLSPVHKNLEKGEIGRPSKMGWECWTVQTLGPLAAEGSADRRLCVLCAVFCVLCSVFCVSRSPVFVSTYRRSPDMPQCASDQKDDVEVVQFYVRQARNRELKTGAWVLVGARGSRVKRDG